MELVIKGVLSMSDTKFIQSFHNGHVIAEIIEKLYTDGLTSELRVIGHMDAVSYVLTQYEVFIIQDGSYTRLKADDLRHLNRVVEGLKK